MTLYKNPRVLAVVALALLLVSFVPANQARVQWFEGICDHASTFGCDSDDDPVTSRYLSPEESLSYTLLRAEKAFEVDDDYEFVVVYGAHICECSEALDPDENVKVHVEGPGGRVYGPWYLTYDEPCHIHVCREVDRDSPGGGEPIVLVSPPVGSYVIVLEPGPGRSELPDRSNVGAGAVKGFFVAENNPALRADNIWWYYPDGSRVFVEDGGYVSRDDVERAFTMYAAVTVLVWGLAGFMGYRAWRLHQRGQGT